MTGKPLHYGQMMIRALRGVIMEALEETARNGLHGGQHFLIEFLTAYPGVKIPGHLRAKFPERMTIVLQHRFRELQASPDGFSVIVDFDGVPARLVVPAAAITAFTDPSVKFGLQLQTEKRAKSKGKTAPGQGPAGELSAEDEATGGDNVVSIENFRKR